MVTRSYFTSWRMTKKLTRQENTQHESRRMVAPCVGRDNHHRVIALRRTFSREWDRNKILSLRKKKGKDLTSMDFHRRSPHGFSHNLQEVISDELYPSLSRPTSVIISDIVYCTDILLLRVVICAWVWVVMRYIITIELSVTTIPPAQALRSR